MDTPSFSEAHNSQILVLQMPVNSDCTYFSSIDEGLCMINLKMHNKATRFIVQKSI
jgi:hypothetical protein